jgi:very-short-patch-repair endonuclease
MHAEDIDLTRATGRGPAVFRSFLKFAQSGGVVYGAKSNQNADRFVDIVRQQLVSRGYQVETNVGVAGVYVDLAVVDPNDPSRFLVGIEVDGSDYRGARTARDRDRLREHVLEGQGWKLVRIWAMEWFQRPTDQLNRLVEAIEAARRPSREKKPSVTEEVFVIERHPAGGDPFGDIVSGVSTEGTTGKKPAETSATGEFISSVAKVLIKAAAEELIGKKKK